MAQTRPADDLPPPRTARPDEWEEAFRLLFRHAPAAALPGRVANALRLLRQGELDPAGVFVSGEDGRLLGAVVGMVVPGASGLVWPPRTAPDAPRAAVEDQLTECCVGWLRRRGAKLGQCLLAPEEAALAAPLERNGFRHVTALRYLRHRVAERRATIVDRRSAAAAMHPSPSLTFLDYSQAASDLFHQTLLSSYEGTLDFPELYGVRGLDDILAGHRSQGKYDPARWWLALADGHPAGVLLLAEESHSTGSWEVAYVGIVPAARRKGVARALLLKAIDEAGRAGAAEVVVTVDARNAPADCLYRSLGFVEHDRQEVFLYLWPPGEHPFSESQSPFVGKSGDAE